MLATNARRSYEDLVAHRLRLDAVVRSAVTRLEGVRAPVTDGHRRAILFGLRDIIFALGDYLRDLRVVLSHPASQGLARSQPLACTFLGAVTASGLLRPYDVAHATGALGWSSPNPLELRMSGLLNDYAHLRGARGGSLVTLLAAWGWSLRSHPDTQSEWAFQLELRRDLDDRTLDALETIGKRANAVLALSPAPRVPKLLS